jgi:hypothetical protein
MSQTESGGLPPRVIETIDRIIAVQRPVVLAHIRGIRRRHPQATPADVVRILERRYLAAVTTGGAAVGAVAMVPAVGTGTALALSGAATVGVLEATALCAQSGTEVHGIAHEDPDRARTLVLALIVGGPGSDLDKQFASQATGLGPGRRAYWGELITRNLPRTMVMQLGDHIRRVYLPRIIVTQSGSVIGKVLPFGIGAVIGGVGNQLLGRTIIRASRGGFGLPPARFPAERAVVLRPPRGGVAHPAAPRSTTLTLRQRTVALRRALSKEPAPGTAGPAVDPPPPDPKDRRPELPPA